MSVFPFLLHFFTSQVQNIINGFRFHS
jgi:hypothetical protein